MELTRSAAPLNKPWRAMSVGGPVMLQGPTKCGAFLAVLLLHIAIVSASQAGSDVQQRSDLFFLPWVSHNVLQHQQQQQQAPAPASPSAPQSSNSPSSSSQTPVAALPPKMGPMKASTGSEISPAGQLTAPAASATTAANTTAAALPPASTKATTTTVPATTPPAPVTDFVASPDYELSRVLPPVIVRPTAARGSKELRLGCILPLGAESSPEDLSVAKAVLAAIKMAVNDELPRLLPDRYVNLTCYDSGCDGLAAAAGVYFFSAHNTDAVIGDVCSTSSLTAAAAAKVKRVLLISPAATSPSLSMKDTFLRTVPSDVYQAFAASKSMFDDFGASHVAMVIELNPYGKGLADNLAMTGDDSESVRVVYKFAPGMGNAKKAVEAVRVEVNNTVHPITNVYLGVNDIAFAADFLKEAAAQELNLPIFGSDTLTTPTLLKMVKGSPSAIEYLTTMSVNPGRPDFIDNFAKAAPELKFESYAGPAYDATVAVLKAYRDIKGPIDGVQLTRHINNMAFEGVSGPVQFDMFGDAVVHSESYIVYSNFNVTTQKYDTVGYAS